MLSNLYYTIKYMYIYFSILSFYPYIKVSTHLFETFADCSVVHSSLLAYTADLSKILTKVGNSVQTSLSTVVWKTYTTKISPFIIFSVLEKTINRYMIFLMIEYNSMLFFQCICPKPAMIVSFFKGLK